MTTGLARCASRGSQRGGPHCVVFQPGACLAYTQGCTGRSVNLHLGRDRVCVQSGARTAAAWQTVSFGRNAQYTCQCIMHGQSGNWQSVLVRRCRRSPPESSAACRSEPVRATGRRSDTYICTAAGTCSQPRCGWQQARMSAVLGFVAFASESEKTQEQVPRSAHENSEAAPRSNATNAWSAYTESASDEPLGARAHNSHPAQTWQVCRPSATVAASLPVALPTAPHTQAFLAALVMSLAHGACVVRISLPRGVQMAASTPCARRPDSPPNPAHDLVSSTTVVAHARRLHRAHGQDGRGIGRTKLS